MNGPPNVDSRWEQTYKPFDWISGPTIWSTKELSKERPIESVKTKAEAAYCRHEKLLFSAADWDSFSHYYSSHHFLQLLKYFPQKKKKLDRSPRPWFARYTL
jgi:hypothetical protein